MEVFIISLCTYVPVYRPKIPDMKKIPDLKYGTSDNRFYCLCSVIILTCVLYDRFWNKRSDSTDLQSFGQIKKGRTANLQVCNSFIGTLVRTYTGNNQIVSTTELIRSQNQVIIFVTWFSNRHKPANGRISGSKWPADFLWRTTFAVFLCSQFCVKSRKHLTRTIWKTR